MSDPDLIVEDNENKFTSICKVAPFGISVEINRIFVEVNQKLCELTGYQKDELVGKSIRIMYLTQDNFDHVGKKQNVQIKAIGTGTVEAQWKRKDGRIIYVLLCSTPLNQNDLSKGSIFTILDITDRKRVEDELRISTRILNKSQELTNIGSWIMNLHTNVLKWSRQEYKIYGIDDDGSELTYQTFLNAVHPDDREMVDHVHTAAQVNNEDCETIHRVIHPNGSIRTVKEKYQFITNESGNIVASIGMTHDITEQRELEKKIEGVETRANLLIYKLSERTKELECMYNISKMLRNINKSLEEILIVVSEMVPSGWQSPVDVRCKILFKNKEYVSVPFKETKWKQISHLHVNNKILGSINVFYTGPWNGPGIPFIEEEQNLLDLIANSLCETIEHKQYEEEIRILLQEKEIMLKEVHHRIKNNMNTIMSLLFLQSTDMKSREAIEALENARMRVQSMMVLYDKLYRSSDFQHLSVKDYLTTLTNEIVDNFNHLERIQVKTEIEDFILDSKTVFNLGIIINELITNTMKYAFPNGEDGKIAVSASIKNKHVSIIIQDNGIGIPESVNIETSEGFGLKLVRILSEQLDAAIKIERKDGTKFILEFNL